MNDTATKLPIKTETSHQPARVGDWMPFDSLRKQIDNLFENFHPFDWRLPSTVFGGSVAGGARDSWPIAPAMDLVENAAGYEITAELPGLDNDNVEIKLTDHTLTIRGEKAESKEDKHKDYYLSERRYGSFQRSFRVPDGIDLTKIDAGFSKGLLTVKLPKTPEAQKAEKKIQIKSA